jgi:serine phosphatase RsbU (regulator of sigma subunit)
MAQRDEPIQFRAEYERELETWLRRRFRYLCVTYLALGVADVVLSMLDIGEIPASALAIEMVGKTLRLSVIAYFLFGRSWAAATRSQVLGATTYMILIVGAISLIGIFSINFVAPGAAPSLILPLFFWHITACLFLPWTPRESLQPFIPLFVVWAMLVLIFPSDADVIRRVLTVAFGPAVLLPGLGIAALRMRQHSESFRRRMVGQQFLTMRREISQARTIHESLFPKPYRDEYVGFDYVYSPMRELGGDFVHLHVSPEGILHLTLVDVTGHGLAAALTVNRLYGELERIRAESPRAEPGEVTSLLNRYICLTMARYNIYATGLSLMLDPYLGELRWANAGHPPMLRRGENGIVSELTSTAVVLGAMMPDEFDAGQVSTDLAPGDAIILYTDGAFEARDRLGKQFGLAGLRSLMRTHPAPGNWPQFINSMVERHRAGRWEDDVLIGALTFEAVRSSQTKVEERLVTT